MKKTKLVLGVGVNDFEGKIWVNGRNIISYDVWHSMLTRCYSEKYHIKKPMYMGCSVSSEWLSFSKFKEWFDGNYREGMDLDKDLLVEGNKVYCKEACRFVPHYINTLLVDRGNARGDLPLGVKANKPSTKTRLINTTYTARCNDGDGKHLSKTFKTVQQAAEWYSSTKTRIVREQAKQALDLGEIGQDVYDTLVAREF